MSKFISFALFLAMGMSTAFSENQFSGRLTYSYDESGPVQKKGAKVDFYIRYPWIKRVYTSPINGLTLVELFNSEKKIYYKIFEGKLLLSKIGLDEALKEYEGLDLFAGKKLEIKNIDGGVYGKVEEVEIFVIEDRNIYSPIFYDLFFFSYYFPEYFDTIEFAPKSFTYRFGENSYKYELTGVDYTELDESYFALPGAN
ncbi:hypothetical protein [Cerasicoccus arenae]|uniref:Uncharacterized protein n=1 Tax=Cerasicoccus arenae TaxID=424488 RepID=A0A8J3DEP2_9BACT|nr:hypothetical protein [Cerasicoccus arenae]MBK1857756.1 hypothetical protein [Cerasicoccus arenae]GHC11883.1 hypothetical protein GCM10007047_31510 [Cerasicoccus arenae]